MLDTRAAGDMVEPQLLVPPATPKQMAGVILEKVVLLRDEMANMAWAVEAIVPSAAGPWHRRLRVRRRDRGPAAAGPAAARAWRCATGSAPTCPGTGIRSSRSISPAATAASACSARACRTRRPPQPSRPIVGRIIAGPTPFFLNEEEVPRAGRVVTREFRRTRWTDGGVVLWIGRRTCPAAARVRAAWCSTICGRCGSRFRSTASFDASRASG